MSLFNLKFVHLTRKKTIIGLNNRNIKQIFYSWLCHSDTAGKILQGAEWSLSVHISNSLGDGIHKATSRWPPSNLRNSLTIFNLKLKWQWKKCCFYSFIHLSFYEILSNLYIAVLETQFLRFLWRTWFSESVLILFFPPMWRPLPPKCIYVLDNSQADIYKTTGCVHLHIVRGSCKSQTFLPAH